ncbi:Glycoside hydrolase family 76 protein [Mycena sanguinolenta]|uniref:Glycoside hydrolase family 76 protein n=1 Tax=Mycena sanguinolenta TaxID=230812 RepID=A0A8H6XE04_9AGAR|nr:Glycoside hydrolase family 76 protein [Mycena sanguinolenta]
MHRSGIWKTGPCCIYSQLMTCLSLSLNLWKWNNETRPFSVAVLILSQPHPALASPPMNSTPSIPQTCFFAMLAVPILSALYRCYCLTRSPGASTSLPHTLGETSTPKTYIVGILPTTETRTLQDRRIAADFAAFRELFSPIHDAVWLAPSAWTFSSWKTTTGDPQAERITVPTTSLLPTIPVSSIKRQSIIALARAAAVAQEHDTIIVVLCGYGVGETGELIIGGRSESKTLDPLTKGDVEACLRNSKVPADRKFLISTASHSGLWKSNHWTLFAVAECDAESASMTTFTSGETRDGVFAYSLPLDHANAHGLIAPHLMRRVYSDNHRFKLGGPVVVWDEPVKADLRNLGARLTFLQRSADEVARWMNALREMMSGVYLESTFIVDPSPIGSSHLPLQPFSAEHLDCLFVGGPSIPDESGDPAVGSVHGGDSSPSFLPLSADERRSLLAMATAHHKVGHPNVGPTITVNALAREVARGGVISEFEERCLLECLRYRSREYRRASVIARELGWQSGEPPEKWRRANGLRNMRAAEARGAAIATEFFGPEVGAKWWVPSTSTSYRRYKAMAPGAWLAHAWESTGSPEVSKNEWARAVAVANAEVNG